jgi:hypothetical protein
VEVEIGFMALNTILSSDELKNIDKDACSLMELEGSGVILLLLGRIWR